MFIRDIYYDVIPGENNFSRIVKKYSRGSNWTRFMILLIKSY